MKQLDLLSLALMLFVRPTITSAADTGVPPGSPVYLRIEGGNTLGTLTGEVGLKGREGLHLVPVPEKGQG